MQRRQFMVRCAAVGGALLGRNTLDFSQRNLGLGGDSFAPRNTALPRATGVSGRIADVDGTTATVDLTGQEAQGTVRVRVVRREYPTGAPVNAGVSDRIRTVEAGDSETVRVTVPRNGRTPGPWFYEAQVQPAGDDAHAYLCESRPYQWERASGEEFASAERTTEGYGSVSDEWFERRAADNEYALSFRWRDAESDTWTVDYSVRRSTHEAATTRERGYVKTFEESLVSPIARDLAETLETEARRVSGPTEDEPGAEKPTTLASLDAGRRFDQFVRFVQRIEYARDAESMGTYDYNRTVPETLVAGIGDCKDRTHLLAGLLSASFDCETALLFQPGHVLLGVVPDDVPSLPYNIQTVTLSGRELVPIEPSLSVPVSYYANEPFIAAYGDGEWFHHDVGAIGRGVDDLVRDWVDKTDLLPQLF